MRKPDCGADFMNSHAAAGIDFGDYQRSMQTQYRALTTYRKGGVPIWLYDMAKIRLVLCQVVWDWIFNSRGGGGECPPLLKNNLVELQRAADVAWARYDAMQPRREKEPRALRRAVKQCGGIVPLLVKVLWLYRLGENSCAIAAETGLKPAAVRQRLHRVRHIADRLFMDPTDSQSPAKSSLLKKQIRKE
jgi:hypothetical protein